MSNCVAFTSCDCAFECRTHKSASLSTSLLQLLSRILHKAILLQNISEFPQRGGANGSVRFYPEITHAANAGTVALTPMLSPDLVLLLLHLPESQQDMQIRKREYWSRHNVRLFVHCRIASCSGAIEGYC